MRGAKASREDIKANPDIASKYKEFNKVRDTLSGKISYIPPPAPEATPRKRRNEDNHNETPQNVYMWIGRPQRIQSYHGMSTLIILLPRDSQRIRMPAIDENEDGPPHSPEMVRGPRKPMIKSLSSMLAGLRKMEEDAADDDLEALNEMEAELANPSKPALKPISKPQKYKFPEDTILVQDNQQQELLGGFDDEAKYDSEPEESTSAPTKTYKRERSKNVLPVA
ncbi:hypothetical protein EYC84_008693 [Monilinia fructicola]|uniref:DNA replication regulator SLD2 n=1 Tax=Monilinia fructicola TaxID=38448 RepID=A0A5M9JDV0_MONFR|nr:hypothetical protein EYC84_008693 [Monilinia fructicola]